jgi:hypothetical protein
VPVCASTGCSGWLWRCGRCPVASFGWIIIKAAASGDELLDSDTVFGVKDSLVKDFVAQPPDTPAPNGRICPVRDGRGCVSTSCWRRQAIEIAGAAGHPTRATIKPAAVVAVAVVVPVAVAVREMAR